ncbi:MAG TPA: hypothetical protein VMY76_13855 [Gemmatimonadales bacterium]|nr:hypothetical protein [Gemmatimonadales bacterium]
MTAPPATWLFLLAILTGCTPWSRVPMPAPTTFDHDTRIQIWVGGAPVTMRAVVVEVDTIRGRAVPRPRGGRDTAVVVPRSAVDSFRIIPADGNNWLGVGALGGFVGGILFGLTLYRMAAGGT